MASGFRYRSRCAPTQMDRPTQASKVGIIATPAMCCFYPITAEAARMAASFYPFVSNFGNRCRRMVNSHHLQKLCVDSV
jgi:hypothetical protein